jgi:hypothetical protein
VRYRNKIVTKMKQVASILSLVLIINLLIQSCVVFVSSVPIKYVVEYNHCMLFDSLTLLVLGQHGHNSHNMVFMIPLRFQLLLQVLLLGQVMFILPVIQIVLNCLNSILILQSGHNMQVMYK